MSQPDVQVVPVAVQSDFIQQQARTTPLKALAECIWNGLDADAKRIEVEIERNALSLERIIVRDTGTGIARAKAPELFSKLGGSWKKQRRLSDAGRELHGSEGRGRYKVTVLGRVADWHVTYATKAGDLKRYTISIIRDDLKAVRLTEEEPARTGRPGVELVISEPLADFRSLQSEDIPQELAEIFATYLRNYQDVVVSLQGVKLDPNSMLDGPPTEINMPDIEEDGRRFPVRLENSRVEQKNKTRLIPLRRKRLPDHQC